MAVAFDEEGTITNVIGMDNTETPGLGTKVQLPDFTDQFLGRAAEPLTIDTSMPSRAPPSRPKQPWPP